MKGVVIFDERANLAFYTLDKEMEAYISGRMQELEMAAGASFNEEQPQRDMRDILGAFFLPLYTSFDVMYSLKKPVLAIEGADGHLIVFRKFGTDVYMAISKEEGETEETMGRKLSVFNSIIHFLHGPVESRINCSDLNERAAIRSKLSSLLCTYETLYLTDQVFLVEALEHVQFGQLTAAANIVQRLTKEALEHQCNGGLEGVNHAMLLANTRFLAVSGKHPRMETSDILLVTLIVHHFYNHLEEVGDSSESDSTRESGSFGGSADTRADGDRYKTPRSTPGSTTTSESNTREERDEHTGYEEGEEFHACGRRLNGRDRADAFRETRSLHVPPSAGIQKRFKNALASLQPSHESRGPSYSSRPFSYAHGDSSKFMEQLIFLQPSPGDYVPHLIYALEVYPGIVLVLVAEHGHQALQTLAFSLCQIIKALMEIDWVGRANCAGMYEVLDDWIKKVKEQVNKEIHSVTDERKSGLLRLLLHKIVNSWSNMKQADIKTFLNSRGSPRDLEGLLPARIEACAGDLKEKLLKMFEVLYMAPKEKYFDTSHVVRRLMHHFTTLNQDYGEFLALKGSFNIPIVSFSMLLPGMIHFLFIDRSFNELTSPSLATDEQVAISYIQEKAKTMTENPAVFLRRKIWSMVQRVQLYLSHGYTLQTWLDDDFLYTYYFWVNIPSSNTLGATRKFYTPSNIKCTEYSAPGVIGSSFFKDVHSAELLKGGGCYVYELYCLHEPKMSIQEASKHCRLLADQLWPSSREAIAPFSLIN